MLWLILSFSISFSREPSCWSHSIGGFDFNYPTAGCDTQNGFFMIFSDILKSPAGLSSRIVETDFNLNHQRFFRVCFRFCRWNTKMQGLFPTWTALRGIVPPDSIPLGWSPQSSKLSSNWFAIPTFLVRIYHCYMRGHAKTLVHSEISE